MMAPGTHSSMSRALAYRPEQAADGWSKVMAFYNKYLAA